MWQSRTDLYPLHLEILQQTIAPLMKLSQLFDFSKLNIKNKIVLQIRLPLTTPFNYPDPLSELM